MTNDQINIIEWFDPLNMEHLKALDHLNNTGVWPENFIPENTFFPSTWYVSLIQELALEYIQIKLKKKETCQTCQKRQGTYCKIQPVVDLNGWCRGYKRKKE